MTPQNHGRAAGLGEKSDGGLLRLYGASRSQQAFAELGRRYARLVYSTCLRETGDPVLAEDAAQGVFLLLSQKAHTLESRQTLVDWLYAASRHVSRNLHKQERRRQMNEARAFREASLAGAGEDAPDRLWEEIEPHLSDALSRLKPGDRQAVLLRFVQEQSLAEVGTVLGLSENTARMRVQRALAKIRSDLGRAGITVSITLLAALLLERAAPAAPVGLLERFSLSAAALPNGRAVALAGAVRRASLRLSLLSALRLFAAFVVIVGIAVGYSQFQRAVLSRRVSPSEQQRLFRALDGIWRGSLEYADDGTGQHFTYPAVVTARSVGGGHGLSLSAAYTGSSAVDQTVFTEGPQAGTFSVTNGGPQSSHRLMSAGELVRLPGGGFAFEGRDALRNADVRIRFSLRVRSLTVQEEYRSAQERSYRFRNRFTLRKE